MYLFRFLYRLLYKSNLDGPLFLLIILSFISGCSTQISYHQYQKPIQTFDSKPTSNEIIYTITKQTTLTPIFALSEIIGKILTSPVEYKGHQVEIIGFYRGWDLLGEVNTGPPVTRNDWVIADKSGAIYVTGQYPHFLDPWDPNSIYTILDLVAIVEHNQNTTYLISLGIKQLTP